MEEKKEPINMKVEERFKKAAQDEARRRGTGITGLFKQLITPFLPENVEEATSETK